MIFHSLSLTPQSPHTSLSTVYIDLDVDQETKHSSVDKRVTRNKLQFWIKL